jgi:hypothetical protein
LCHAETLLSLIDNKQALLSKNDNGGAGSESWVVVRIRRRFVRSQVLLPHRLPTRILSRRTTATAPMSDKLQDGKNVNATNKRVADSTEVSRFGAV